MSLPPMSVLDLSPIVQGSSVRAALANSLELARHVERLQYRRVWYAEHHSMPGIASAATSVLMAHIAAGTSSIRVGAGGIMLPNHAPLLIAEQFGTLEALHPGRIELALGRAPGSDQLTQRALRRDPSAAEHFAQDVIELQAWLGPAAPDQAVRAVPGEGSDVPLWILGSSLYGAQLAAALGLPYAFASHFAPAALDQALHVYRERFRPSAQLAEPYAMCAVNVIAADSDAEGRLLASSLYQTFVNLRTGRPGQMPPPRPDFEASLGPAEREMLKQTLECSMIGSKDTVRAGLEAFAQRTRADELIVSGHIFDHAARLRSYELTASLMG